MPEQRHRWDETPMQSPMQPPIPRPGGYGPQQNPGGPLSAEERNWAMACHLAAFSGYLGIPFGHILGPLIVWIMKRDTSAFINEHGKEAMNYNISITIYFTVCFLVGITIIGLLVAIPAAIALGIADIVFRIIAAMKASNGERYSYPMTIRFLN